MQTRITSLSYQPYVLVHILNIVNPKTVGFFHFQRIYELVNVEQFKVYKENSQKYKL